MKQYGAHIFQMYSRDLENREVITRHVIIELLVKIFIVAIMAVIYTLVEQVCINHGMIMSVYERMQIVNKHQTLWEFLKKGTAAAYQTLVDFDQWVLTNHCLAAVTETMFSKYRSKPYVTDNDY